MCEVLWDVGCQTDTRLADARDKANERGLTRAEVTFYASSIIPCDKSVDNVLQSAIRYVTKSLVHSTLYRAIWIAYCNKFKHPLVCIDRSEDIGMIVYSYNEITGNISSQV